MPRGDQGAPGPNWDAHRQEAQVEDVLFLVERGLDLDAACARVGCSRQTIEKRLERARG